MLLTKLNQPEILGALGTMGHGSRILIADGCYPFITGSPAAARKVYLNLSPGIVLVTDVLKAIAATIPLEEAFVMMPPDEADQPIFSEFRQILPKGVDLTKLQRFTFYDKAREADTALMVATGDQRNWANLLLTVGYIKHG